MNQQKSFFTDEEYRILLSALGRERKVCEQIAAKDNEMVLLRIMNSIENKIKLIQYPDKTKCNQNQVGNGKYVMLEIGKKHKCINSEMRRRTLFIEKRDETKLTLYPIIFDWRAFTGVDYTDYESKIENNLLYSGDYIGCVRVGNLLTDLSVYSKQQNGPITKNDEAHLCLQLYVGGVDTGYAYGRNGYPYDCVDDAGHQFSDEMISDTYTDFQAKIENKIVDLLKGSNYDKADLVEKATESLRVW